MTTKDQQIAMLRDVIKQFQYAAHEILSTQSDKMRLAVKMADQALAQPVTELINPAQPEQEQQPVDWKWLVSKAFQTHVYTNEKIRADKAREVGFIVEPLYAAPIAPKSTPRAEWATDASLAAHQLASLAMGADQAEIDHCVGVIQAALKKMTTPPAGYWLAPMEPMQSMIVAGFESKPDRFFDGEKYSEEFDAMSGCQQAAFIAKRCYLAMRDEWLKNGGKLNEI